MSVPTTQTGPVVQTSQANVSQPLVQQPGTTLPPGQGGVPPGLADVPAGTIGMPVAQVQEQSSFSNGNGAANPQAQWGGTTSPGPVVQTSQASTGQPLVPQQGAGFTPQQDANPGGSTLTWTASTPAASNESQSAPASFDAPEAPASNPSFSSGQGSVLPSTRAGLPPGHGGVPPGQGGVPPGQAQASTQAGPTVQTSQASVGQPLVPQQSAGLPPGQGGVPPGQGGVPPGQAPQANTQAGPATQTSPANLGTPLTEIPLANNPVRDGYNVRARTNTDPLLRGMPIETPVKTLVPPLQETKSLDDVKNRFAADYPVLKTQVTDLPHLKDPEKATRAFDFFAQYANRFVAIATGEAQKGKQENAEKQAFKGNGATKDAHLEVPLGPDMPKDLPTSKPVIKSLGADGHLMHGQEGEGAHGTGNGKAVLAENELGLLMDGDPQEPKKPAGNEGRLARLLAGELAKALDEAKVPKGAAGDFVQAFKGMALPQGMSREEVQKQAREFAEMLRSFGFEGMRELFTGKNGVQLAYEMLTARSPQDLERMLQQKQMTAEQFPPRQSAEREAQLPPENYHPATLGKEPLRILKELGESRPELDVRFERERLGQADRAKVLPWAAEGGKVLIKPAERDPRDIKLPWLGEGMAAFGQMGRKLGSNMLWNVLHRFREVGPDSAIEKEKFDQLAFGAIMLLVLLMGATIALVNL